MVLLRHELVECNPCHVLTISGRCSHLLFRLVGFFCLARRKQRVVRRLRNLVPVLKIVVIVRHWLTSDDSNWTPGEQLIEQFGINKVSLGFLLY